MSNEAALAVAEAAELLHRTIDRAANELHAIIKDETASYSVKACAASTIIGMALCQDGVNERMRRAGCVEYLKGLLPTVVDGTDAVN